MSEERVLSDLVWTPERGAEAPEVRGISWENFLLSDDKYLGKWKTDSGIRITPETALQSTVVLSCCRILAETVSGLPLHVYRRNPDGSDEIAKEIPLYKILTFRPNEWQTKAEFFEQIMMNLTLWGNSYTRIRSGLYGSVSSLDNLHPSRMDVERLENGRLRYSYTDPETGRLERYTQDQIMHVRWTPEQDGIKGMVPVEIAREAIGLARACEQHAARFWANSARPGVVLQTDGTLTAEAAERLRDNWERLHRGSERAYKTAILTGGLKAQELGMTNESSQFVASREFQTAEICRVYRIAQHLIQGTSGGDLEVQGQEFVTYTLMPWLTRIESSISRSLIYNDDEYYAKFDVRGLLRANSNARASYYSTMINLGVFSINDVLRHEGMKTLGPIGDHHFVPMNTQTLEDATQSKQGPPAAGSPPSSGGGDAGGGGEDGPPPPVPGGPPSMSQVKTGAAPVESPKGEASKPKAQEEDAIEESSADWEDAVEGRGFCATGPGGGIDNSCSVSAAARGPREIVRLKGKEQAAAKKKAEELATLPKGSVGATNELLINHTDFRPSASLANSQFAKVPSDERLAEAMKKVAIADSGDAKKTDIGGVSGKSISAGDSWIGFHRDLPAGTPVAFRIDIPTFNNTKKSGSPVYAVTVHEDDGKLTSSVGDRIGYDGMARMAGPVHFLTNEKNSLMIATGVAGKNPIATVKGNFDPSRDIPGDIDSWTPVGYDPQKAAYFYDKRTGQEVNRGTDALSVGNTVFTRQPQYGPRNAKTHYRSADEMFACDSWGLESRSLSAANQDLYVAQEEIAEENGKWPQSDAHYMENNPFASRGMKCSNCLYFEEGQCEIVQGSVSPDGICKLWIIPEEKLLESEARAFCATGPGGGRDPSCPSTRAGSIRELIRKISQNPNGFTLDPKSAQQPKDGIMVSEFPNGSPRSVKIKASEIKTRAGMRALSKWYAANSDALTGKTNRFVGGWKAGDDFYIDVTTRFDADKASEALEAGRKSGQLAVFNLGTLKETWIQYEHGDSRKPAEFDKEFAKARKDSQEKQVYDSSTPAIQDEDWAKELVQHGKSTVRSYNETSEEDAEHGRPSAEVRHSEQAHDHRGLPGDACLLREDDGGEGREAGSVLVRRRAGDVPVAVRGSTGASEEQDGGVEDSPEDRAFCATGAGGGVDNSCAAKADNSWKKSGDREYVYKPGSGKSPIVGGDDIRLLSIESPKNVASAMKGMKIGSLTDVVAIGGGLTRGAFTSIHESSGEIHVMSDVPLDKSSGFSSGSMSSTVSLGVDNEGKKYVDYGTMSAVTDAGTANLTGKEAARASSLLLEKFPQSLAAAERAGFDYVKTFAMGDKDSEFKGYRLWPQFGFDAPIDPDIRKTIPKEVVSHDKPLTIQKLISTAIGTKWWNENGESMGMTLNLKDKKSDGYKRFQKMSAMAERLKKRNEGRSLYDFLMSDDRAFCPTGPGGGVKNSCGSQKDAAPSGRPASVQIDSHDNLKQAMSAIGVGGVDDVVSLGGGNVRGANVAIKASGDRGFIYVTSTWPVDKDNAKNGQIHTSVSISDGPDGKELGFESFGPTGDAVSSVSDQQKVMSIVSEKVAESISAAQKNGFAKVTTFAIGDAKNQYKGYRLWPQFGFDGDVPRDLARKVPAEIVLKSKGVTPPPPGSTSIPHDLVVKSLASRLRDLTIQELISTRDGDTWWDKNGDDVSLTLDLKDKSSLGYKRWEKMQSRLPKLRERNKSRSHEDDELELRGSECGRDGSGKFDFGNKCASDGDGKEGEGKGGSGKRARPPAPERVRALTTQQLFDGTEKLNLEKSRGAVKEETIAKAMTERAIAANGGAPVDVNKKLGESDLEVLSDALADDTRGAYERTGKHAGWYSKDVGDAVDIASKLPGNEKIASDPVDRFVFSFGLGILSAQNTVPDNFRFADGFYQHWKETGSLVVPKEYASVLGRGIDTSHFQTMQQLVDKNGWSDTMKWFAGEDSVRRISQDGKILLPESDTLSVGKEHQDTVVPRFAVFGPKLGPFTHAVANGNFDHLVMDRWTMRQAGSLTGTLYEQTSPDTVKGNASRLIEAASGIRSGHELWRGLSKKDVISSLKDASKTGYLDDKSPGWEFIVRTTKAYAKSPNASGGGYGDKTELNLAANAAFKNKVTMNLAPGNGTVANNVREVFGRAAKKVGASNVLEVQALGWGDTQKLWQHLGYRLRVKPEDNSFSFAAAMLRDGKKQRISSLREEAQKKSSDKRAVAPAEVETSWPNLDVIGAEAQLIFDESMSNEGAVDRVVDYVTSQIKESKQESRSSAAAAVIELRSSGLKTVVMPKAGREGLHVMGFDAEIPQDLAETLPETLSHCKTLLDLHVSSEGRSWWEQNGRDIDVAIDLEGVQGRIFDGFAAGKTFSDIIEEGILDDYGNS